MPSLGILVPISLCAVLELTRAWFGMNGVGSVGMREL
jgi:hypothetical protein